jgi:hypothetical protein
MADRLTTSFNSQLLVAVLQDWMISEWLQFWLQFADVCPRPPTTAGAGSRSVRTQPDAVGHSGTDS